MNSIIFALVYQTSSLSKFLELKATFDNIKKECVMEEEVIMKDKNVQL